LAWVLQLKYQIAMNLKDLSRKINARLYSGAGECCPEVKDVHAADTMSSLIANASRDTLLVTTLNNNQLVRVAELMDAPGLCLVGGAQPSPELLAQARETGAAIMVSPFGLEDTRRMLEECLAGEKTAHRTRRDAGRDADGTSSQEAGRA
jgi:hypothetical protein